MHPTLLLGLDGATFSILDSLMENGTMPFLKNLVDRGVRAELRSTSNPLTPPAWTSLMTGRSPGYHGIIDFIWAEQRRSDHYFTLYNYRDIQCETIWSLVSRQQGSICSLNYPMMAPPPTVNGYIVPGLVSWKHLRRNTYPTELFSELQSLPGFNPKEFAWDFGLEKKAAKGVPKEEFKQWIEFHICREKHWCEITKHILQKKRLDLASILFDGIDKILHIGWRFLDPQVAVHSFSSWERDIRTLCLNYFLALDSFLAEIVSLADPDTRIFIASDHGFGPAHEVFRVNTWLHEQGYLYWKDVGHVDGKTKESVQRLVDQHFVLLDWDRTTAYARTTTSNGIYIRIADDENGYKGVPRHNYQEFRQTLINKLKTVCDPLSGEPVIKDILTREEAYPGPNNHQAPDLTIVMRDHSFLSILNKIPAVCRRPEIEGTHYPQGVFIACGPGIRQGVSVEQLSILDIAPTVLYSLGLDIPADLEGRFPEEIFDPAYLVERPCSFGEPTKPPDSYALTSKQYTTPQEEENVLFEQMKALGYIE
jgi:predicted AlkP superfamily phosphohydrolase/phosphomutase